MSLPPLPEAIGRYRPLGVLGSGAMGTVFRAHDPVIDRMVAIKVVRTAALDAADRADFIDRFRREVQAAGRCAHPAIVGVFDFSDDLENPFIVMELVEGTNLQALLRDPAARARLAIVPLLGQVLDGLGAAHRLGVVHRDMKPANILVTAAGQAKIADFGIARLGGSSTTQIGTMLGTPSYMSPEQVSDDHVDHRADLFAVGAILHECLTGAPPFAGRNLSDTLLRVSGPAPADMTRLAGTAAAPLIPVLERALAKRRQERFQSAEEFGAALRAHEGATPPPAADTMVVPRGATASFPGRWDPSLLGRVEKVLARYAGPMARVMLAEAAAQASNAEDLYQAIARSLSAPGDRAAFLRAVGERIEPSVVRRPVDHRTITAVPSSHAASFAAGGVNPMATAAAQTLGAGGPIPQAAIEAGQAALVVFVGPMARVMARQAAAKAASPDDFLERLCANVPNPEENAALRRRLRADVEPKLR